MNKQLVNSEEDFAKIESSLKSGQDVVFLVRQRGSSRQVEPFSWPVHFRNTIWPSRTGTVLVAQGASQLGPLYFRIIANESGNGNSERGNAASMRGNPGVWSRGSRECE